MRALSGVAVAVMLAGLAWSAWANERALAAIPIGDLVLSFDAATWRVERRGAGYAVHAVDASPGDLPIVIELADAGPACTAEAMQQRAGLFHPNSWEREVRTIARPGFDLHVATLDLGCRNWTGSPVFACAVYRDREYFVTADPGGCRETPPNYDGPVLDLLMGLAAP